MAHHLRIQIGEVKDFFLAVVVYVLLVTIVVWIEHNCGGFQDESNRMYGVFRFFGIRSNMLCIIKLTL